MTSATVAPNHASAARASTVTATPCAPAPNEITRPASSSEASATTGQAVVDPKGVIVPRS